MAERYEGLAKVIVQNVGGRTNIDHLVLSGDTLSFALKDVGRANTDILKETKGIADVSRAGERFEVSVRRDAGAVYAAVAERAGLSVDGTVLAESSGGGAGRFALVFLISFVAVFIIAAAVNGMVGGPLTLLYELLIALAAGIFGSLVIGRALPGGGGKAIAQEDSLKIEQERPLSSERLGSPVSGTARELSEISDEAFSSGALGPGIWFEPRTGKIYAPCDGVLTTFFESGHALGIRSDRGAEVLIHIGMNTVQLKGEGFSSNRKQGDYVKRGELLITFDIDAIRAAGYRLDTPMVITNSEKYAAVSCKKTGKVEPGENVLECEAAQ